MCRYGSFEDASRLYELPGGRLVVLPMVRRRYAPGPLASQTSFPLGTWGMGGVVAPGGMRPGDAVAVFADLDDRSTLRTSLLPNPLDTEMWAAARPPTTAAVWRLAHVLPLEGGFARVWKERFSATVRRNVRKAERSGVTVECDTSGRLVPVMYELFERSLERWADQQHEPPCARALARPPPRPPPQIRLHGLRAWRGVPRVGGLGAGPPGRRDPRPPGRQLYVLARHDGQGARWPHPRKRSSAPARDRGRVQRGLPPLPHGGVGLIYELARFKAGFRSAPVFLRPVPLGAAALHRPRPTRSRGSQARNRLSRLGESRNVCVEPASPARFEAGLLQTSTEPPPRTRLRNFMRRGWMSETLLGRLLPEVAGSMPPPNRLGSRYMVKDRLQAFARARRPPKAPEATPGAAASALSDGTALSPLTSIARSLIKRQRVDDPIDRLRFTIDNFPRRGPLTRLACVPTSRFRGSASMTPSARRVR